METDTVMPADFERRDLGYSVAYRLRFDDGPFGVRSAIRHVEALEFWDRARAPELWQGPRRTGAALLDGALVGEVALREFLAYLDRAAFDFAAMGAALNGDSASGRAAAHSLRIVTATFRDAYTACRGALVGLMAGLDSTDAADGIEQRTG